MQRLRLYDLRLSRLPTAIGFCRTDIPSIAQYVNGADRRLVMGKEAGDEGWWGTWAEMAFNVGRDNPYLTTPRSVARLELATVCENPVQIQNQFYEYLDFGNGRLPKRFRTCRPHLVEIFTRNTVPTFVDLTNPPQIIRVYSTDAGDADKRVLLQGTDNNGNVIRSLDTFNPTTGIFVSLASPSTFVDAPMQFNTITGIQKDVTLGDVQIFQVDPTTGQQIKLLTMEPSEQTASYRRYYFDALPSNCCPSVSSANTVTVTAIVKLDLIPVQVDTDYTLIQNAEAIIEECQAIRYSEMDSPGAKQLSRERHNAAIGLLNGELAHYLGTDKPAINFKPFGSARLSKKYVGKLF